MPDSYRENTRDGGDGCGSAQSASGHVRLRPDATRGEGALRDNPAGRIDPERQHLAPVLVRGESAERDAVDGHALRDARRPGGAHEDVDERQPAVLPGPDVRDAEAVVLRVDLVHSRGCADAGFDEQIDRRVVVITHRRVGVWRRDRTGIGLRVEDLKRDGRGWRRVGRVAGRTRQDGCGDKDERGRARGHAPIIADTATAR
jgi:hypothetical protein